MTISCRVYCGVAFQVVSSGRELEGFEGGPEGFREVDEDGSSVCEAEGSSKGPGGELPVRSPGGFSSQSRSLLAEGSSAGDCPWSG